MNNPRPHSLREIPETEGLACCTVCGGAEGELLSSCPGFRLNSQALEACFRGDVVDLQRWVVYRRVREGV